MQKRVTYQIRRATEADSGDLARLRYAFRIERTPAVEGECEFIQRCRHWMSARLTGEAWRCWVAEEQNQLLGTLWLQLIEKLPNPVNEGELYGYISSVYVIPQCRNAGIGGALLDACLGECDREEVDAVFLWSTPGSRMFYRRKGFAVRDDLLDRRSSG